LGAFQIVQHAVVELRCQGTQAGLQGRRSNPRENLWGFENLW
jgi:hypothetical protein